MPALLILCLDLCFIAAGIEATAWVISHYFFIGADVGFRGITVSAVAGLLSGASTAYLTGLYLPSLLLQRREVLVRCVLVGVATAFGVLLASHLVWYQGLGRAWLFMAAVFTSLSVLLWRLAYASYLERGPRIKVAVLGNTALDLGLVKELETIRHTRLQVVGTLGDDEDGDPDRSRSLGDYADVVKACQARGVETVLVIGSTVTSPKKRRALAALRMAGIDIRTAEIALMSLLRRAPLEMVDDRWLLNMFEQLDQTRDRFKRVLDVLVALAGLAGFAVLLPFLYVAVRLDSKGPFFFSQSRVGVGNRPFSLYKIRTMSVAPEATESWAKQGDDRTTRVGRFLRRSRIDELPQFWNVLVGEMSVVGPRPEQPSIAAALEEEIQYFGYRHLVRPGITGWAQIHFGYAASVHDSRVKLAYDLYYVRHHTLVLDVDVMLRTFFVMLARIGSR